MNLIRCRQCGEKQDRDLYTEDCYHDVTCNTCGARTGKYGDENEAIALWNGKGVKFYAVMWQGQVSGAMLELWDDEQVAMDRVKKLNDDIQKGIHPLGFKIDTDLGIRDLCHVQTIESNVEVQCLTKMKKS